MLQKIREKISGWVAGFIIALIAGAFVFWGIQYYFERNVSNGNIVAIVNGVTLTRTELQSAVTQLQRDAYAKMGAAVYQQSVKNALSDYALQTMITQTALQATLQSEGFRIGLPQLKAVILHTSALQDNGQFSPEKLQMFLSRSGLSIDAFFHQAETQWIIHQGMDGLWESAFALPSEVARQYSVARQQRAFSYAIFSPAALKKQVTVSDAEITDAYHKNVAQYQTPAQLQVAYVILPAGITAKLSQQLSDLAYTNPDSLAEVSKTLSLTIQYSPMLTRNGQRTGVFVNPKVWGAVFSDSVFEQGNNSDPISLANGSQVVLRVAKKVPGHPIPLTMLREKIKASLIEQKAEAQAGVLAFRFQQALLAGQDPTHAAAVRHVVWQGAALSALSEKSDPLHKIAFEITPAGAPYKNALLGVKTVPLPGQGYAVIALTKILTPPSSTVSPAVAAPIDAALTDAWGKVFQHCFLKGVMQNAHIDNKSTHS